MSNKSSNTDARNSISSLIEKLLRLSRQIIDTKADYILVLEEYAEVLSLLEPQLAEAVNNSELTPRLVQLETLHLEVMSKVSGDKDRVRKELSSLKKKGKVLLTYTDQLPKRISLSTTKKV